MNINNTIKLQRVKMKKKILFLVTLIVVFKLTTPARAVKGCPEANIESESGPIIYTNSDQILYKSRVTLDGTYKITIVDASRPYHGFWPSREITDPATEWLEVSFSRGYTGAFSAGTHQIIVKFVRGTETDYCTTSYNVEEPLTPTPTPDIYYSPPHCTMSFHSNIDPINGKEFTPNVDIFVRVKAEDAYPAAFHRVVVKPAGCNYNQIDVDLPSDSGDKPLGMCNFGTFSVVLQRMFARQPWKDTSCIGSFNIKEEGGELITPGITPQPTTYLPNLEDICAKVKDSDATPNWNEYEACIDCVTGKTLGSTGAYTAIGCIPTTIPGLLSFFFKYGVGIAGGIAFLLLLFGGFTVMTSSGNPEKVAAGKEMITAALTGLLVIIFSVFILKLIGVTIFRIPGFK